MTDGNMNENINENMNENMNAKREFPNPTPGELEILRVLWKRDAATVREVHAELHNGRDTGYTTTLKLLQIMTEKGLVARDEAGRAHVYRPLLSESQSQRRMVSDMVERVFGGAAQKLVLHALSTHRASSHELAEIRRLLDTMERSEESADKSPATALEANGEREDDDTSDEKGGRR